jgi:hypothetical protein
MARQLSAGEVAQYIRNLINDQGGEWDWDDFESSPIADPELDRIRREAALAGPPHPDFARLDELAKQAEALKT